MHTAPRPCAVTSTEVPSFSSWNTQRPRGSARDEGRGEQRVECKALDHEAQRRITAHEAHALAHGVDDRGVAVEARGRQRERGDHCEYGEEAHGVDRERDWSPPRRGDARECGPITRPRFHCADESTIAPGRSSTGTRSAGGPGTRGTRGRWRTHAEDDQGHDAGARRADARQERQQPHEHRLAAVVASSRVRRGTRSATAPPSGAGTAWGRSRPRRRSRSTALPVLVVTRMPTPTVSIHVPMFDTNAPPQPREAAVPEGCEGGAERHGNRPVRRATRPGA